MIDISHLSAMRIDDRVATVLAIDMTSVDGAASAWRQAVDLLAQRRVTADGESEAALIALLARLRPRIEARVRRETALVAGFGHPAPALIETFVSDEPGIVAALLGRASLDDNEWETLLPRLGPVARGILRARRDLSARTERALASFGASDMVISARPELASAVAPQSTEPAPSGEGVTRISDLVARIDAYRRTRIAPAPAPVAEPEVENDAAAEPAIDRFAFETDAAGLIVACDAPRREALIGMSIAEPAFGLAAGVDGVAAGAFRKRAAFREARLLIGGASALAGDWQIGASPRFDEVTGRFLGFSGSARRPRVDERAGNVGALGVRPESLRQLIHELRTPINAIAGFAQMIERQLLGPVAHPYRDHAGTIVGHADSLLAAVDDLDAAARLESAALSAMPARVELSSLVERAVADHTALAGERGVGLVAENGRTEAAAFADPRLAARAIGRLVGAAVGVAGAGETIAIALDPGGAMQRIAVTRPARLASVSEAALLRLEAQPGDGAGDADAVALLGTGFALRLVANLARAMGGRLEFGPERLTICLPAAAIEDEDNSQEN